MGFIGVVVITSDLHAEGPRFDPQMNLYFYFFQEEQSLREERELLATIQHQNSLMLTNHYNRPYLPRNEKLTS